MYYSMFQEKKLYTTLTLAGSSIHSSSLNITRIRALVMVIEEKVLSNGIPSKYNTRYSRMVIIAVFLL